MVEMNPTLDNSANEPGRRGLAGLPCPTCGAADVGISRVSESFSYGEGPGAVELTAEVPLRTCNACGFQFLDSEAEDAQHEAVCRHLGVLTPTQIRALRVRLGLTRAAFAQLTRLGEATLARWERGALIQTAAYDQFLYLLHDDRNVQELRNRLDTLANGEFPEPATERTPRFRIIHPTDRDLEQARTFRLHRVA